ncbi:hypothetical protein BUALT_Bualt07G0143700 [Buddleja alternifolia]|uniref:Uncharacterized protein n=1 Tax=Buddleja alternifolia TaxID=168488 RepID=A0AAV6XLF0_9LAMI|nr:hypothetical protein BUALT_Bualt07G0143700 [Buddleja alternifolia]
MEATREAESFIAKIKPPRLEDAGLEDCALPPESIHEAFLKAASAVRSLVSASDDEDQSGGRCVDAPWEDSSDALVGVTEGVTAPSEGCAAEKGGGLTEVSGGDVVLGGVDAEPKSDALVVSGLPESVGCCVDGLQGLEIGGKSRDNLGKNVGEDEEEGGKDDKPILAEGYM